MSCFYLRFRRVILGTAAAVHHPVLNNLPVRRESFKQLKIEWPAWTRIQRTSSVVRRFEDGTLDRKVWLQLRCVVLVLLGGAEEEVLVKKVFDTKPDMSDTTPTGRTWSRATCETDHGSKQRCRQTSTPRQSRSDSRLRTAG